MDKEATRAFEENAQYEECLRNLAASYHWPLAEVRTHFEAWCKQQPVSWRECYRAAMAGNQEWLWGESWRNTYAGLCWQIGQLGSQDLQAMKRPLRVVLSAARGTLGRALAWVIGKVFRLGSG